MPKTGWTRNQDDVLVLMEQGNAKACIYAVGMGIYAKPYKVTGIDRRQYIYQHCFVGMSNSISKAKVMAEQWTASIS